MKIFTGIVAGCLLVGGCATKSEKVGFKADENSGKPKKAAQGWVSAYKDWSTDKDLGVILQQPENQGLRELLMSARCMEPTSRGNGARAAGQQGAGGQGFVVAGTRQVFDLYADRQKAEPEQLKRGALNASSVDVSFPTASFRGVRCAVYARYAEGDSPARPGLLAVLAIEQKFEDGKFTDYFKFRPLYARVGNSIATTAGGTSAAPSRVAVSFALVAKQLVVNSEGAATFAELGTAAVSVARVRLNGEETLCTRTPCTGLSPPIPVPVARGSVVLSIGVSEAGDVGADMDQVAAEREAVKAALGSAAGQ